MSLSNLLGADPGYIDHLEEADRVAGRTTLERRCEEFEDKLKSWGECSSERTKDPIVAHFPLEHLVRCLMSSMPDEDRILAKIVTKLQGLYVFKNACEEDGESFSSDPNNELPRLHVLSAIRKISPTQETGDEVLVLGATVEKMGGRKATWAEHRRESRWTEEERKEHESDRKELGERLKKLNDPKEPIQIMEKYKENHQPHGSHGGEAVALEIPSITPRGRCIVCRGTTNFEMVDEKNLSVLEAGKSSSISAEFTCAGCVVCIMNERVLKKWEDEA